MNSSSTKHITCKQIWKLWVEEEEYINTFRGFQPKSLYNLDHFIPPHHVLTQEIAFMTIYRYIFSLQYQQLQKHLSMTTQPVCEDSIAVTNDRKIHGNRIMTGIHLISQTLAIREPWSDPTTKWLVPTWLVTPSPGATWPELITKTPVFWGYPTLPHDTHIVVFSLSVICPHGFHIC